MSLHHNQQSVDHPDLVWPLITSFLHLGDGNFAVEGRECKYRHVLVQVEHWEDGKLGEEGGAAARAIMGKHGSLFWLLVIPFVALCGLG